MRRLVVIINFVNLLGVSHLPQRDYNILLVFWGMGVKQNETAPTNPNYSPNGELSEPLSAF